MTDLFKPGGGARGSAWSPSSPKGTGSRCQPQRGSLGAARGSALCGILWGAMPAITATCTNRRRPSRGSAEHFLRLGPAATASMWTGYATAVWGFMLHPFNLLIATGMPGHSWLRPSLSPGNGPRRVGGLQPRSGRPRRTRLSKPPLGWVARPAEPPLCGALRVSFWSVVAVLRAPLCLPGGFVQLASI